MFRDLYVWGTRFILLLVMEQEGPLLVYKYLMCLKSESNV